MIVEGVSWGENARCEASARLRASARTRAISVYMCAAGLFKRHMSKDE